MVVLVVAPRDLPREFLRHRLDEDMAFESRDDIIRKYVYAEYAYSQIDRILPDLIVHYSRDVYDVGNLMSLLNFDPRMVEQDYQYFIMPDLPLYGRRAKEEEDEEKGFEELVEEYANNQTGYLISDRFLN